MHSHTLTATPPFDFAHSLAFIRGFKPTQGEQHANDSLCKATRVLGRTVQFTIRAGTTPTTLRCVLTADAPLSAAVESAVLHEIRLAATPHYGPLNDADLRQIAEHYGPWQRYWANYLRAVSALDKAFA